MPACISDWYLIKDYQETLMRVYYDAGLKNLVVATDFRAETLTHLQKCSNFQHAHHFLIEAWEAMLQHLYRLFIQSLHIQSQHPTASQVVIRPFPPLSMDSQSGQS